MGFLAEGELLLFPTPLSITKLVSSGDPLEPKVVPLTFLPPDPNATFAISVPVKVAEVTVQVWVDPNVAYVAVKGPNQQTRFKISPEDGSAEIILRRPTSGQEGNEILVAGSVSITSYSNSES